jgi:hypothetical protein
MFITKEFHYPAVENVEEVYPLFSNEHITRFMDI